MTWYQQSLLLQAIRLGIYLLVLLLTVVNYLIHKDFLSWEIFGTYYLVTGMGLLFNTVPLFQLSVEKPFLFPKKYIGFIYSVLDVCLISFLIWATQANQTLFFFMYLIIIFINGMALKTSGALSTALLSSIGFSLVSIMGVEIKGMNSMFLILLNNGAFFFVALLSAHLSEQLEWQGQTLKDLQKLNSLIVESIPMGLMTVQGDGLILRGNPEACHLLEKDFLENQNLFEIFPQIKNSFEEALNKLKNKIQKLSNEVIFEMRIERKQAIQILKGMLLFQEGFNQDLEHSSEVTNSSSYLLILEDLTLIKKLEEDLRHSEKLAAVGQLAAGIAHEIRNPLASISGSIEMLSQQSENADDKKLFKIILKEIQRLNNLISEFLDFARPERPPSEAVAISIVLKEIIDSMRWNKSLRPDIIVDLNLNYKGVIIGDANKLKQALLNVLANAYHAVDKKSDPKVSINCFEEGDWIKVQIIDNGMGMNEENRKKMFEPFHTTKTKGTGLGLAITHKILKSHGAQIFVQSELDKGTIFEMSFPHS